MILIRGARQSGKSTWLEGAMREAVEEFGAGSALCLAGDHLRDADQLALELVRLTSGFAKGAKVRRLFVDEITAVPDWARALKRVLDRGELRGVLVVTTGSYAADLRHGTERLPGRKGKTPAEQLLVLRPPRLLRLHAAPGGPGGGAARTLRGASSRARAVGLVCLGLGCAELGWLGLAWAGLGWRGPGPGMVLDSFGRKYLKTLGRPFRARLARRLQKRRWRAAEPKRGPDAGKGGARHEGAAPRHRTGSPRQRSGSLRRPNGSARQRSAGSHSPASGPPRVGSFARIQNQKPTKRRNHDHECNHHE